MSSIVFSDAISTVILDGFDAGGHGAALLTGHFYLPTVSILVSKSDHADKFTALLAAIRYKIEPRERQFDDA
jgi:hypothetical protein